MAKGLPRSLGRYTALRDVSPKQYRYVLNNLAVTVAAAGAGVAFGTVVLGDLPEGQIIYHAGTAKLGFTTADTDLVATWNGDFSIGTAPDADGSLAGTEVDIIASTSVGPAVARVAAAVRGSNTTAAVLNNQNAAMELNLNVLVDAADFTDAGSAILLVNGYLDLVLTVLFDD
jgi:hypothetical protein